ncbi:hypothetical protein BC629DRAFT_1599570 [Irpex lacteus]|nr:hypothetical protein BC629DRAFT_1599570 [Irpex lacteus]
MDIAFDTTWCPTCSRQILPKRIQVPVTHQPLAAAPAPPPSSPTSQTKSEQPQTRVARKKTVRARSGGLVHGTGRVKPNGTIKRPSPSNTTHKTTAPAPPPSPTLPAQPAAPVRQRTIIDQSPTPLYCSDECRMLDMQSAAGLEFNYNPERHGSPTVSTTAPSRTVAEEDSSDSSIGSSPESEMSSVSARVPSPAPTSTQRKPRSGPIPTGYAALASIYDIPPCPPPPPFQPDPKPEPVKYNPANDYTSGIIMAARRIQSVLGPQEKQKPSWSTPASKLSTTYANDVYAYSGTQPQREVIPGWTDGSDKWRASVYSFARPDEDVAVSPDGDFDNRNNAYRGFVSTPCRSRGVYSTMGESKEGEVRAERMQRVASQPVTRARSEAEELYTKWDMSFARRCESRTSTAALLSTSPTGSTHSLPTYASRKSRSILKKGAEGKLLVPDVQMKRTDSRMSFERLSLSRQGSEVSVPRSRLGMARTESTSGSSVVDGEEEEVNELTSLDFKPRKARSPPMSSEPWYKDEQFTYPVLTIPRKEKKLVTKVVDGKEVVEEVTVEVYPERKRLFLFPGRDQN